MRYKNKIEITFETECTNYKQAAFKRDLFKDLIERELEGYGYNFDITDEDTWLAPEEY